MQQTTKRARKSYVWRYMKQISPETVQCLICKKNLAYNKTTSTMIKHIKSIHSVEETIGKDSCSSDALATSNDKLFSKCSVKPAPKFSTAMTQQDKENHQEVDPPSDLTSIGTMTADTAERHLNLQWKNFQSCFQISVNSLRDDTCFQDVTLSCSGQLLHANRLVLAACSTHFRQLFETIPAQQHAVLVLPTVDADVMRAVLDFIYCGEVCVRQSLLGGFLQFADAFCIKGLSGSSRVPRGAAAASAKSQQRAGAGGESRPAGEARPPAAKRRHCSASIEEQLARADQVTFVANFDGGVSAGADTAAGAMPQHPQENDGEEVADCDGEDGAAAGAGGGGGGDDGGDGGDGAEHSLVSPSMCEDDREEQEVEDSSSAAAGAGGGGGGMMARKSSAGRRWSSVWDYYEVSGADDSQLVCKLCDKVFRNMAGDPGHSSSNYWKHLRRIHHIR